MKPNFDVCLIMKNEEATLPRLLKSLDDFKAVGGNVYILDTGSTDKSVEIARAWGCHVEEVGEKYLRLIDKELADNINDNFIINGEHEAVLDGDKYFDFAAARNHAASLCAQDWCCFADADEEFTKLDIEKMNEIIADPNLAHCEYEFVFAHRPDGSPAIQFRQSKMYNRTKIEWQGIVHECIMPINGGGERIYLDPSIFLLEHWQQPGDRHSYLKGLLVDCYLHPEKDRNSHYAARELMYSGRYYSAIKEFKRHTELNGWLTERAQSMIHIGDCYKFLGDTDSQKEWYMKAYFLDPSRREALIKLAQAALDKGDFQAAVTHATGALTIPWHAFYANDKTHYEDVPHAILYRAYGWLGNIPKAQEHILQALRYQPYNPEYLRDTAYYFEYKDPFIEGWMKWEELLWLYETSKSLGSDGTICEIGSWQGKSTHALLSGGAQITAVDTFKGSDDPLDATNSIAKEKNIFGHFCANTNGFENLAILRITSEEASKEDRKYQCVFIDALHTKEGVMKDIALWKDKATEILCGHDYDPIAWPGVVEGVDEALGCKPDKVVGSIWIKYMNK